MFVDTYHKTSKEEIENLFKEFNRSCKSEFGGLYSSPQKTVTLMNESGRPQPLIDSNLDKGMTTLVGELEVNGDGYRLQYFALSHNLKKGAAKGAVQTAEFLLREGYIG